MWDATAARTGEDQAKVLLLTCCYQESCACQLDLAPNPVGFHLEAGAGRAFDIMSATEKDATGMRFFEQAYVDVKPASWKGLELDFGKFSSWASAEVIETPGNGNYSRSLLFVWSTPITTPAPAPRRQSAKSSPPASSWSADGTTSSPAPPSGPLA
jgi:hypothetical protein